MRGRLAACHRCHPPTARRASACTHNLDGVAQCQLIHKLGVDAVDGGAAGDEAPRAGEALRGCRRGRYCRNR
jgi:hypothetical protein